MRRPLWLLAIGLDGAGIVLELFALREASLIIVQPLMSVGLIGLVFAAAVFLGSVSAGGGRAQRTARRRAGRCRSGHIA